MLAMSTPLSISAPGAPAISAEAGDRGTEGGRSGREAAVRVDDRWGRAGGIPPSGIGIPRITGLLDGLDPRSAAYWIGSLAFLALAAAIWHGNRRLLFEPRPPWGWFAPPGRQGGV